MAWRRKKESSQKEAQITQKEVTKKPPKFRRFFVDNLNPLHTPSNTD
jgi:hypothetical protein